MAVLGAGIAGLVAAHRLQRHGVPVMVYEGQDKVAGMATSHVGADGFSYDIGGHFITNRLAAALGAGAQCRLVARYDEAVISTEDRGRIQAGCCGNRDTCSAPFAGG